MNNTALRACLILFTLVALTAPVSRLSAEEAPASGQDGLRVMVWNVLRGGNRVEEGPEKALAVIRAAEPDVVLLQESYDIDGDRPRLGEWLAGELGWNQHQAESAHLCVLTPLELEATFFHHAWHGVGARLKDERGRAFLAWSIWIDYRAFIGYELRDDPTMDDATLLAAETERSGRAAQAEALLAHLETSGQLEATVPLLVGGDWNCPSHLDWTLDGARVFRNRRALELPVSRAMIAAGFTDAFRDVHPNPVQHPGITWSPMYRGPAAGEEGTAQSFERIDRLYLRNPAVADGGWTLRPVSGHVLPLVWEEDAIPAGERIFPSDHGALVMNLEWVVAPRGGDEG